MAKANKQLKKATAKGKDRLELAVKEYIKGIYIERIPSYSWTQALKDSGYSDQYARSHTADLRRKASDMIDKAKAELFEANRYNLEDWENELKDLYRECRQDGDKTNAKGCLDMAIKLNGGFITITKDVTEVESIPESDTKTIQEQARLANIQLSKTKQA